MKLVVNTRKKTFGNDTLPMARLMSQGIKLSTPVIAALGINVDAEDQAERKVNYAQDEETGTLYIAKSTKGAVVGGNSCFTDTGLAAKMLISVDRPELEIKGGVQVHYTVDVKNPVEFEGMTFFALQNGKVIEKTDDEGENDEAPASKSIEPAEGIPTEGTPAPAASTEEAEEEGDDW